MTQYTPFELKEDIYTVCPTCDIDGSIKKALELQEKRKLNIAKTYTRKQFKEVLCTGHEADADAMPWEEVERVLDEVGIERRPKESFVIEEWMVNAIRSKDILPGIDPRT